MELVVLEIYASLSVNVKADLTNHGEQQGENLAFNQTARQRQ
jgi:hypothetical protein